MRRLALASVFLFALAGCESKGSVPAPAPEQPPVEQPAATPAKAAFVVFAGKQGEARSVGAAIEDGSKPALALSRSGVDTTFVKALTDRRALLAAWSADGSIAALEAVRVDTAERAALGSLPAGQYASVAEVRAAGDAVLVELARLGSDERDVFALRAGAEPKLLAAASKLVGAAGDRAAVLTKGNLKSIKLDGTASLALGPGDGRDQVAEVRGGRVLFTIHAGSGGDVRLATLDGSTSVQLGQADADETAFALTGKRLVYVRRTAAGAVLVSAGLDGKDERALSPAALDAKPVKAEDERVFFTSAKGALHVVDAAAGGPVLLDPAAGTVTVGAIHGGLVIYRSELPHWPALRAARLDGAGVTALCDGAPKLPFFGGVTADHRVVYYRSLAGQLEGGRVYSVALDGKDERPIGTEVVSAEGLPVGGPLDQDFEAITPAGRVIIESEFTTNGGSQLLVGGAASTAAKILTGTSHVRFQTIVE